MEKVFISLTSPGILHDSANFLVEIMLLNSSLTIKELPWRDNPRGWSQKVACIKKLVRDFNISYEQLACYIYRCSATKINSNDFAKMAIVAKQLIPTISLEQIYDIYSNKIKQLNNNALQHVSFKQNKTKTLQEFLRELENNE